ncbi:MAG: hypothetical protein GTO53_03875, partial [Planctomycetales bacterium]|nr:hypothetical protein [Planctomycetales bacterium]NIM08300.1 hypothetical protein [Planctomycetales bacterium]NIN08566.1 hypothetical protein [Planctomycetales bacterium]NIN76911.1 hypothetical protein [Planctomycetales bacterium]NIO34864.1 hypothetical protein [Planctomycetales bacterium]
MLIRKPFFALAALATFGLSCLAMSDAFSSDSPDDVPARPGEVSSASINTDARHPTIAGMATTDAEQETATAAIRRIPPVVPNIRWLPPLPADQLQVGEVIP